MIKQYYAIFGDPVAHSKSPLMHNLAFRALGIDACYGRHHLTDGFSLRDTFFDMGLSGANITVPHKEAAFAACDVLDPFAQKVGAVNTIVRQGNTLHGYNTDAPGFLKAIEPFDAHRVLFLGAGGTAQSTAIILREAGYDVTILNRSEGRLEKFKAQGFTTHTFDTFTPASFDLIVNMTSAGLSDESLPAPTELIDAVLANAKGAVDVIYGKETPFLRRAKAVDIPTADGTEMLLQQGVIAFDLFTDGRFEYEAIEGAMRRAFVL
jgi:shikimate dehydrogenase